MNHFALYVPSHGKRKPGRPRLVYLQYIQHLLGDTKGMLQPNKITSLAQDRSAWSNRVVFGGVTFYNTPITKCHLFQLVCKVCHILKVCG